MGLYLVPGLLRRRRWEEAHHLQTPILEDALQVLAHHAAGHEIADRSERHAIADAVADDGAAVVGLELVGVVPQRVGAAGLRVDEALIRLPVVDAAAPAHRYPVQSQRIAEPRALLHLVGADVAYIEVHERRSDALEIAGVG